MVSPRVSSRDPPYNISSRRDYSPLPRSRLQMQYADQRNIEILAKVGDLVSNKDKTQESAPVDIDGIPWRVIVSATTCLHISIACQIEAPSCVYATATLSSHQGQVAERFDAEHCVAEVASIPIPTIRRSNHPMRTVRLQVTLRAEPPTSLKQFEKKEGSEDLTDIIFEIEGHQLHLHRVILACASPVFHSMLFGHFVESESEEKPRIIPFPDKDLSLMLEMLSTIYPPQLEIHAIRAKFLLPLYMEYQIGHLITKCERVLCESEIYTAPKDDSLKSVAILDEVMDHLLLCSLYKLDRLQELAVTLMAKRRSEEFDNHVNFSSLSDVIKLEVYKSRVYRLEKREEAKSEDGSKKPERTITPDVEEC